MKGLTREQILPNLPGGNGLHPKRRAGHQAVQVGSVDCAGARGSLDSANLTKDQIIQQQQARIEVLELNLSKLRDLCWLGYYNTRDVLPSPTPNPLKVPS